MRQPEFFDERGSFIVKLYKHENENHREMTKECENSDLILFCKTPRIFKAPKGFLGSLFVLE